jgi:hypothetical protein
MEEKLDTRCIAVMWKQIQLFYAVKILKPHEFYTEVFICNK